MEAMGEIAPRGLGRRSLDRVAAVFLLLLLGAGSLALWVGIPVGCLWLFSKLTRSWNGHFLLSLVFIPIAMALFAPALFWLNGLYLRVTGVLGSEDDEDGGRRLRGPLELFLYLGMVAALVALFAWFFLLARNPPEIVW
jgi:ABC-type proline/glycine betaine transport system permease subunit